MRNNYVEQIEKNQIRTDLPTFKAGDNIQVHLKIKEGAKERIQVFEGLVIAKRHQGTSETFTVRKISYGIGVEKTFALNSPLIQKIKVVKVNKIRRAKLYYMRKLHGKATRLKELKK